MRWKILELTARAYCAKHVPFPGASAEAGQHARTVHILLYSHGASNDFCTVGPSFRNASGWSTSPRMTPSAGRLLLSSDHTSTDDGQAYGSMIARAGDDVSAAHLTLDDRSVVTATVEHGCAVAWWPGIHHLAAAKLSTPSGTRTQTFPKYPATCTTATVAARTARPVRAAASTGSREFVQATIV